MTLAQLRTRNRENARKSTGPKTDAGKAISRSNALKHGLTAVTLTLPDENPDDVAARNQAWVDALRPGAVDEAELVDQLAYASLRLQRCARTETEILADQIRKAELQFDLAQDTRLIELTRLFREDSVKAVTEMQYFAPGVAWLIDRWEELKAAFETVGYWNNLPLIREAIRLCGYDADRLRHEKLEGYEFALLAVTCIPDHIAKPQSAAYLEAQMPPCWLGRFPNFQVAREIALAAVRARIATEIDDLTMRAEALDAIEEESREGAKIRAHAPEDTSQNRTFLRYMKSTETGFDRTLKTLGKLQEARRKAAENAAEPAERNEAGVTSRATLKRVVPGSYVNVEGKEYFVGDVSDGNLILLPVDSTIAKEELPEDLGFEEAA